jgi:hypothetical protein
VTSGGTIEATVPHVSDEGTRPYAQRAGLCVPQLRAAAARRTQADLSLAGQHGPCAYKRIAA